MNFLNELKDMDSRWMSTFSKYYFEDDDESYKIISKITREYRGTYFHKFMIEF